MYVLFVKLKRMQLFTKILHASWPFFAKYSSACSINWIS